MWRHALAPLLGLSLSACAASTNSTPGNVRYSVDGRGVLTAAEIVAARVTDVYQAVSQLRPHFLRRRISRPTVTSAPTSVTVYVDDLPFGGVESLSQIPLERVRMIRYISAMMAEVRFGG